MTEIPKPALDGFAKHLFAGIPVKDLEVSIDWYSRLLGCPPSFFPNDIEAVWQVGDGQWLYLIVRPDRAGGAVCTLLGDALSELTGEIAQRGIHFDIEDLPEKNTRKVVFSDPDGNEVGFASVSG